MKKITILYYFVGLFFVSSCININTPRAELKFSQIIADSLFTSFPGTLRVTSNHILMMDPFNATGFLKVYDRRTGEEILSAGTIGRGPSEWNNPDISNVINDRVSIFDGNLKQFAFTDNTILNISNSDSIQKIDINCSKFVYLSESHYIVANWEETHPFKMLSNGQFLSCGTYPFKQMITNSFECFQGSLQIYPQKELLVYTMYNNPYIALYKIGKDNLNLIWEKQFKSPHYSIIENQLRWDSNQPDGVSDVAFTKDYIICLVKDFKNEAIGRDVKSAPKAIYVFDFDGQLIHIFDLPVHSIRLASDAATNTFYSVALEPDYRIVEYDLSTVGL